MLRPTVQEAISQFGFEGGSVISISSLAGSYSMPSAVLYSATKAAVENLTHGLSAELGFRQIRVNVIAPGYTRNEGTEAEGLLSEKSVDRYVSITPLGRLGEPADIAAVAVFLASDASLWVTRRWRRPLKCGRCWTLRSPRDHCYGTLAFRRSELSGGFWPLARATRQP